MNGYRELKRYLDRMAAYMQRHNADGEFWQPRCYTGDDNWLPHR